MPEPSSSNSPHTDTHGEPTGEVIGEVGEVVGAGGVVFHPTGEVLLLGHREGAWVFPKGHLDPGESPLEAALREVAEEAGVRAVCPDETQQETTRYRNARGHARRITWFLLLTDDPQPVLRETLFPAGGFFVPEAARSKLSFPEDRALLERMLTRLRAARSGPEEGK